MSYEKIHLKSEFQIDKIISIQRIEYKKGFSFHRETLDFWRFLCVINGEIRVMTGDQVHTLKKGSIIFHKPGESHQILSSITDTSTLVRVSFECNSESMSLFENRIFTYGDLEKNLLSALLYETEHSFVPSKENSICFHMDRKDHPPFASEQLITLYLQVFLIQIIRLNLNLPSEPETLPVPKENREQIIFDQVCLYLREHIGKQVKIEQICKSQMIGRTSLHKIFQDKAGCGVIDYFLRMKIEAARQMIKSRQYNFTEIATLLGYSSIHYFSKQFKKMTGMTPSEYASSCKEPDTSGSSRTH